MRDATYRGFAHLWALAGIGTVLVGMTIPGPAALAQTVVPDLQGKPLDTVRQVMRLRDVTLCEGVFYIAPKHWRDDVRPMTVYMQSPRQGTAIPDGANVACWILKKAPADMEAVRMPDLHGLTRAEVAEKLKRYRMPIMEGIETPDGIVADQYPRANQPTYTGTSVFLILRHQE